MDACVPRALAISQGHSLRSVGTLDWIRRVAASGIDALQIREKELADPALLELALAARRAVPEGFALLINARFDIAVAAGANGVHLRADSVPLAVLRSKAPGLLLGKSTHELDEIRAARDQGADYVTFGPVYAPLSKPVGLSPVGLSGLEQASRLGIPVLGLGGIDLERLPAIAEAGAAGVAAITLFQPPGDLELIAGRVDDLWPARR